jgi:hypothetical protein
MIRLARWRAASRAASATIRRAIGAGALALCASASMQQAGAAPAAQPDHALVQAASAARQGKFDAAAKLLEAAMPALAANARAWRLLGFARLRLHRTDAAIQAYRQSLKVERGNEQAFFYLGVAQAQRGAAEAAFEWLARAKASRRYDMTQIQVEKDLEPLRADPRFAALLPVAEDFKRPFVENVRIVHEWDGEAAGDQFGWIARVLGDVDGDGFNDFVTSAPTKRIGGDDAGRVYVYSGRSGALLWSVDGKPGDQLGTGVEAAGDTDGDGVPDVIASAPTIDTAYVYSGRDGRLLLSLHGEAKGDNFGQHVSSAGDIDGDGYADLIVGAPNNGAGGKDAGRAYVYSGKDGHLLLTLTGERPGDQFGSTVTGYARGDQRFLVVGAPGAGPRKVGRVYVYRGLSDRPAFTIEADETGQALGEMFVSVLGDVDGDGIPDVFASDWYNAARGPLTGRIYVHSGRTGRRLYTLTGSSAGEGFGTTHSTAGDVDGDGRADLVVGAWQYSGAAQSGGRAYLFDGANGRLMRTYTCRTPGDTFGFDAVGFGEVDDHGQALLLVTSGWSAVHGNHSGRVFLIASGVERKKSPSLKPGRPTVNLPGAR